MATVTGFTAAKVMALVADLTDAIDSKVDKDALVISVKDHGVVGDGSNDDTTAFQTLANAAAPGTTLFLPPGTYVTNAPITLPPQVTLRGSHGGHIDDVVGAVIKPSASFTGAAVILMVDQTAGGYSRLSAEQRIEKLSIDGANLTGSTIDGIQSQGLVHGVYITDVQVRNMPNHGYTPVSNGSGSAYSWRFSRFHVSACGGIGITASMTDATYFDCEVIGSTGHGWFTGGAANSVFVACRSEWSGNDGFNFGSGTGTGNGSGGPIFIACTTDRNNHNGVSIPSAANGNAPIEFVGCTFRRDGRGSSSSGYAGINVVGSSQPVIISACSTYPGPADDGSGIVGPQYGLSVTSGLVQVTGGSWHAVTEGIHNGGSNVRFARNPNMFERTGPNNAPVNVTRGVQTHGTDGGSLHVPEYLAGMPHPRLFGYAGWTYPQVQCSAGKAGVAGTLYLSSFTIPSPVSITKLGWGINTAGSGAVAGQNFIGLYDSTGARLVSFGVDARAITAGAWQETISALALNPGLYWFAYLFNATGMPAIYRSGDLNGSLMNLGLPNSKLAFATNGTGQTTLPSSITPSSNASAQFSYWGSVAE